MENDKEVMRMGTMEAGEEDLQEAMRFDILNDIEIKDQSALKCNAEAMVDDAFYGWVYKKGAIVDAKRLLILRLHTGILSVYKEDNLWEPHHEIQLINATAVSGWVKPSIKPFDSKIENNPKFTVITAQHYYFFKASIEGEATGKQWVKHIRGYMKHVNEANSLLSSKRFISLVPERHAVVPVCSRGIRWNDANKSELQSRAEAMMHLLDSKFPYQRFIVAYDENKNGEQQQSGILKTKKLLGTLDVFETIPLIDSGFVIVPDIISGSPDQIIFSLLDAISFPTVLKLLRDIDNIDILGESKELLSKQLAAIIISVLAQELDVMRDTSVVTTKEFRLLAMFVGFNFAPKRVSLNPQLNVFSKFDNTTEQIIIQVIGEMQALLKCCTSFFSARDSAALKHVEVQLNSLFERITRSHTTQELKLLKTRCLQIKNDTYQKSKRDASSLKQKINPFEFSENNSEKRRKSSCLSCNDWALCKPPSFQFELRKY